jgi:hypothetical protein
MAGQVQLAVSSGLKRRRRRKRRRIEESPSPKQDRQTMGRWWRRRAQMGWELLV